MQQLLKKIPAVSKILNNQEIKKLGSTYSRYLIKKLIRQFLQDLRNRILEKKINKLPENIEEKIIDYINNTLSSKLKPVVNATGIIIHTNLGRAPLGKKVIEDIQKYSERYCNLEFDLKTGKRGQRNNHLTDSIRNITGAENLTIVNNNAAGVLLTLKTLAENTEVIISRGELIEIGGSFRIPDILRASGAKMIEVGTTNKTKISDYENAITDKTKIVFKAHKSNYFIGGFSEEVDIKELSKLCRKYNLLLVYDIGSGLLKKPHNLPLKNEPDVRSSIDDGADLVCFSCDKLLGGPQAGIIAGKEELINKIDSHPLMRTYRVGKLTLSALNSVFNSYLNDDKLIKNIPLFKLLNQTAPTIKYKAEKLKTILEKINIPVEIVNSKAQCGGGTLPDLFLN